MHRKLGERGFADELVQAKGHNARLEDIDRLIDWRRVEKRIEGIYDSDRGRPSYPLLVLAKSLLLAQWYSLSDPGLEEALGDRLSFRRFAGLSLEDPTPDHVTLWNFRQALGEDGRADALLAEINSQLEQRGLMLKRGTLLDATLVRAQAAKPRGGEPGHATRSTVDPDARWAGTGHGSRFGYKAHLAVDQGSGLVRRAILTPANVNESSVADELIAGDEQAVYADKAYESKVRRQRLRTMKIKDRIMHRSHKNQAQLPYWQQRRNAILTPIRRQVERVFGTLKRGYGYTRVRYYSIRANATQLALLALAINLRRAAVLST
jgi:IS5 family transposase